MKYWEIIADNLHDAGWSLGWVSALDVEGRTIWIADAHRDDGKHFVVRADEKLTATGYLVDGKQRAGLNWSGATSANVDVYRNGGRIATTARTASTWIASTVVVLARLRAGWCNAGTQTCSNNAPNA